jgi:hypothetical protein
MMDTALAVYTRSGLLDRADEIIAQILRAAPEGSRSWFRARTRQAEILILRGVAKEAVTILAQLAGRSAGIPDEDVVEAARLLEEAQTRILSDSARTVEPPARPLP